MYHVIDLDCCKSSMDLNAEYTKDNAIAVTMHGISYLQKMTKQLNDSGIYFKYGMAENGAVLLIDGTVDTSWAQAVYDLTNKHCSVMEDARFFLMEEGCRKNEYRQFSLCYMADTIKEADAVFQKAEKRFCKSLSLSRYEDCGIEVFFPFVNQELMLQKLHSRFQL